MRRFPAVSPRGAQTWALTVVLASTAVACSGSPAGEAGEGMATVVARPVLPAALGTAAFSLDVDRVRLLLVRQPSELILDSTVLFPVDSTQLTVRLKVLLAQPKEQLNLALELRSGKRVLFSGARVFEAVEGSNIAPTVPLQYVGPGSDLTSLTIEPRDSALKPGDTFTFSVRAFQGRTPVDSFYVGWASSDPKGIPVDARGRMKAPSERGSVTLRVVAPTGVKDSTRVWFSPPAFSMRRVSGDGQQGRVGDPLPEPLAVQVTATDGLGMPGARVRLIAPFGSRVQDSVMVTDADGYARTTAFLGTVPTLYSFEARLEPFPPVIFQAVGVPGSPAALAKLSGDGQVAPVGQTLAPLSVRVLDRFGNGVGGVQVGWEQVVGGGTLSAASSVTDATGRAAITYTLGSLPGTNVVRASVPGVAPELFTATGTP